MRIPVQSYEPSRGWTPLWGWILGVRCVHRVPTPSFWTGREFIMAYFGDSFIGRIIQRALVDGLAYFWRDEGVLDIDQGGNASVRDVLPIG